MPPPFGDDDHAGEVAVVVQQEMELDPPPWHVETSQAWRSACVRLTSAWNSVRGKGLRSWLNMRQNRFTGAPLVVKVSKLWWPPHHHTAGGSSILRSNWTRVLWLINHRDNPVAGGPAMRVGRFH